jgi:hypothetical protein
MRKAATLVMLTLFTMALAGTVLAQTGTSTIPHQIRIKGEVKYGREGSPCTAPVADIYVTAKSYFQHFSCTTDENGFFDCTRRIYVPEDGHPSMHPELVRPQSVENVWFNNVSSYPDSSTWELNRPICLRDLPENDPDLPPQGGDKQDVEDAVEATWGSIKARYR